VASSVAVFNINVYDKTVTENKKKENMAIKEICLHINLHLWFRNGIHDLLSPAATLASFRLQYV